MSVIHRFVADRGDPIDALLERSAPSAHAALAEGRVFVEGRRAEPGVLVRAGDRVEVWAARPPTEEGLRVLHEEPGLVVVDKPAGMPSEPDHHGRWSVQSALLAERPPGAAIHLVSRLDAPVSGAMIVATSERGLERLVAAQREGRLERRYVAIAAGSLEGSGDWRGPVDGGPRTRGGRARRGDERDAETRWRAVATAGGRATLLALEPVTGRKHQLRAHAAAAGAPLFGDRERRGPSHVTRSDGGVLAVGRVMLHAHEVALREGPGELRVVAPVPEALRALWAALDGDAGAWHASSS